MGAPKIFPSDRIIDGMKPEDRAALGLKTREERTAKVDATDERTIQNGVEAYLRQRGYWPRTPAFLDGKRPERGWYIHLHEAKRNPIVLDLLILGHDGRYLELELKTASGPIRPHQEAILMGRACIARSVKEAMDKVKEWEDGRNSNSSMRETERTDQLQRRGQRQLSGRIAGTTGEGG